MLAFITSMRHPDNADDYGYNEKLLEATLRSLTQQSSQDYVVFVVGNRAPSFQLPSRVHFVEVDYAPPARVNGPHANREGFVRDKGSKIGAGLIAARQYNPDWVMIFDADDFVHRDLVDFVHRHADAPGWVIQRGWIYSRARNGYRAQDGFNRTCGTSYVIPFSAYDVPNSIDVGASQQEIIDAFGDVLPNIMGAHRNATSWHASRGRELRAVPFRAAVYHVDTGENHSRKALPGLIHPWNSDLLRDYAIQPTRERNKTLWSCYGPKALVQSGWALLKHLLGPLYRRLSRLTGASTTAKS